MRANLFCVLLVLIFLHQAVAQSATDNLNSPDALYRMAATQSYTLLLRNHDEYLARITEKAANANLVSLKLPVNGNLVNNTLLPVNFIPAEIFGIHQLVFYFAPAGYTYPCQMDRAKHGQNQR